MINTTKQNERKYLLRFLADKMYTHDFTPIEFTEVIQCLNDPPDFAIKIKGQAISIEITTLNVYNFLSKKQFCMNNVAKKVIKKIDAKLKNRYDIKIGESLDCTALDINENKLTNQIFEIIKNFANTVHLKNKSNLVNGIREIRPNRYLIEFKTDTGNKLCILLSNIKEEHSTGRVAPMSVVYKNEVDVIFNTINKKEKNLPKYKKNYNKNYLLLVTDPYVIQGCVFEFDENLYNHKFKTDFDKIFLMGIDWSNNHKIRELTISS